MSGQNEMHISSIIKTSILVYDKTACTLFELRNYLKPEQTNTRITHPNLPSALNKSSK